MKLVLMGLLLVASQAQAALYKCVDESGANVAEIGFYSDGSASYGSPELQALGTAQVDQGPCPSRLCGSFKATFDFDNVFLKPEGLENIYMIKGSLANTGIDIKGSFDLFMNDGRAPQIFQVTCEAVQ